MHHQSIKEATTILETNAELGLSFDEARERLIRHGSNKIERATATPILVLVLRQFKSPIVFLLLFAATLSFAYSRWSDGIAVLVVLFINTCIGFIMEFRAERSMTALRRLTKSISKVIRSGSPLEIPTTDLVPGDLVIVEAGDIIPADARITRAFQLQVNESAMTGESLPIEKSEGTIPEETILADRTNMVYKGTAVTRGNGRALVVATGMETELGKIALLVQGSRGASTPIERKLEQFSKKLIWITLMIAIAIFLLGVANGKNILEMLNTVIALSVAAIPEGLPIVATLALAHGMMKMAKRNVIVKKLASVETLGGTNVICTDKTGTLTHNKIKVSHFETGDFRSSNDARQTESSQRLLESFVLCNNANLSGHDGKNVEIGDPLEAGLLQFAASHGVNIPELRRSFPKVFEDPFKSETKRMVTSHSGPDGGILFAKGASETIIDSCSFYHDRDAKREFSKSNKAKWLKKSEDEASKGHKVIAFAFKQRPENLMSPDLSGLTFLGIASLVDPPREDVPEAIRDCHDAGIRVVMVTGDHPSTAKTIALQVGIISDPNARVIQGSSMPAFDKLSREAKLEWRNTPVFARVSPAQKLDLIHVLQENHSIVAMTGDGINDAPALKKADIGIAMGLRGTDVAKEVADMVLKDDSFTSIVSAIREGRIIFENIRKFLMFLLSSNLSEILVIAGLFLTNSAITMIPLQILFINLLSDVFPALALGFSKGSRRIMDRPPRDPRKPVLSNLQWMSIMVYAVIISVSTYSTSLFTLEQGSGPADVLEASTVLFYTLILAQLLHVFSVGDHRQLFFRTDIFKNGYVWAGFLLSTFLAVAAYFTKPVRQLLHLGEIDTTSLMIILACGFQSFVIIQVLKRLHLIH